MKRVLEITYWVIVIFEIGFVAGVFCGDKLHKCEIPELNTREMRVTAYCPCSKCCGKWSDGFTACGYQIRPGDKFVAAPKNIAFGTMIYIPQYADGKSVEVLDRGGSIEGDRLDVYFPSHQEALNWGVKVLKVRIDQ